MTDGNAVIPGALRIGKMMHRRWLTFLGISAVCIAAIWLPFGFAMNGLIEEWQELSMQTFQGPMFSVDVRYPTLEVLRPLGHVPFGLAFVLGPDSFVSWHVMLMLALATKGCASSELVYKATKSLPIAAVAGVLIVLYPADTMQYPFRALHINWSLALALLAGCVYLAAWDRRNPRGSLLAAWAAALLLAATLMYEAALTCLAVPFLILVGRDGLAGFARGIRERSGQTAIWCSTAVLYGAYAMWMSHGALTYEARLLNGESLIAALATSLPKLLSVGLPRALFGGWVDAFGMVAEEYQSYGYLLAAASVLAALVWLVCRKQEIASNPPAIVRLACVGVVAAALGYAPYLLSPAHVGVSQRTYLYASFGAVVFWSAILMGTRRVERHLIWPAAAALILLGLGAQLFQFNYYVRIAQEQKRVLRGIVENFDERSEGKTLIVIDGSGNLGRTWMFLSPNLTYALEYLYERRLKRIPICQEQLMEWEEVDSTGRKGRCVETDDKWIFRASGASPMADLEVLKKDAIVLRIDTKGMIVPDSRQEAHRAELLSGQAALARRYRAMLAESDWGFRGRLFGDERAKNYYEGSFGRWWSMDPPIRGFGWRGTEWDTTQSYPTAFAWKLGTNASLFFDLVPTQEEYLLQVKFAAFSSEKIHDALRTSLNGANVECRWLSFYQCEAHIAPSMLHAGANEIAFISPIDPNYYGLSAALHSFSLAPTGQEARK